MNLIVLNDANPSGGGVEGRMYVGNNATLPSGYPLGATLTPDENRYDLVVGNDLAFGGGVVLSGAIAYGGRISVDDPTYILGGFVKATPIDFEQLTHELLLWSNTLAETPANGTTAPGGNLFMEGNDSSLNVFEVTDAELAYASQLSITVPQGSTVLINVSGLDVSITDMGFNYIGTDASHVIFNMPQTDTIFMSGVSLMGIILAPRADLNFENGNAEGQTIVYNLISGEGEYHAYYFEGCPW